MAAGRKRLIVDPSAFLELLLKKTLLAFRQVQAILIGCCTLVGHTHTIAHKRIEHKCCLRLPVACIGVSATAFIPGRKARGSLPAFL